MPAQTISLTCLWSWNVKIIWCQRNMTSTCCRNISSIQSCAGHRISGVRRNYVTWLVFFSIHRQMKEDHDVIFDDQMTLQGSYQQKAPFISVYTIWQSSLKDIWTDCTSLWTMSPTPCGGLIHTASTWRVFSISMLFGCSIAQLKKYNTWVLMSLFCHLL